MMMTIADHTVYQYDRLKILNDFFSIFRLFSANNGIDMLNRDKTIPLNKGKTTAGAGEQ